ncbi:MAG: sigma-54 dependent transcriptional regulator [Thermoanaerobaculia bacterium]
MKNEKILIVEDKISLQNLLKEVLQKNGYNVDCASDGEKAEKLIEKNDYHLIIADYKLPKKDGMEILKEAKEKNPDLPVIIITAYGTIELAVEAMKRGAEDFLLKPIDPDHLLLVVEKVLEKQKILRENILLKSETSLYFPLPEIIGTSPIMKKVSEEVNKVAPTDATVLLLGESGTGKELFARAIHSLSKREKGPFVAINCAAIPETLIENELFGHEKGSYTGAISRQLGKFELAQGGTIFLDEIGELSKDVQGKVLRVLQEKTIERIGGTSTIKVDVRILCASNQDLKKAVEEGRFREDLFYRINIFPITIPPLRNRTSDIPLLVEHFISKYSKEFGKKKPKVHPEAMKKMLSYHWPGNVRELENAIERAIILSRGDTILPEDIFIGESKDYKYSPMDIFNLPDDLQEATQIILREVETYKIEKILKETEKNIEEAAKRLNISTKTLREKIKKYGIEI